MIALVIGLHIVSRCRDICSLSLPDTQDTFSTIDVDAVSRVKW